MAIKKKLDKYLDEVFQPERLEDVLGDRFGRYSKYIIQERAIPDIRDGLKPVQRRILYAMNEMGIFHNSAYKKSARICGDVMGKYHPHGDSSIYEAMVRMSQDFKMGVRLIDMHGNNGSIDGDSAAAMRYTEARMTKYCMYLLEDINKNTVSFVPNFDESELEPIVLPAKFPNLLVNGSKGIASGYATDIPPHNIIEVINAAIAKINKPNLTLDELLEIMPGPDFPTGGIVEGAENIRDAFNTGSGSIIIKSKVVTEQIQADQKRIVVLEIPFDTNKARLVEKIDQLRIENKIDGILEVRDESDREGLRIAIDLKKGFNEVAVLAYLFKNTDLQTTVKYNMVAIDNKRPQKVGVLQILDAFIEHQKDVLTNKTNFMLNKDKKRLHIVLGLCKMIDIVDEVIALIRKSINKADSIDNLVKFFEFTHEQAEAIVNMQLYRLSTQDIVILNEELETLNENIEYYNLLLSDQKELLKVIKKNLVEMKKNIVAPRLTEVKTEISEIKIEESELISKEQVVVCVSKDGYIKRVNLKSFNASKNNNLKENDSIQFLQEVSNIDTLLMFTNLGNYLYLPIYKINECKTKDIGAYISDLISITPGEKIIGVYVIDDFKKPFTVLLATKFGMIKQTELKNFECSRYTKAIRAMKLSTDDKLVSADIVSKPYEIVAFTKECEALRIRNTDISMYGLNAGGIKLLNLKPDDEVISVIYANKEDDALLLTTRGFVKRIKISTLPLVKRVRATCSVIKKVKSNPHYLIDAKKLSSNQYKENVEINLMYQTGNDKLNAFDFKYNQADSGISVLNDSFSEPLKLFINKPSVLDKEIDDSYLIDKSLTVDLFNIDEESEVSLKSNKVKTKDILQTLDDILNTNNNVVKDEKKEDTKLPFKKISLFDE